MSVYATPKALSRSMSAFSDFRGELDAGSALLEKEQRSLSLHGVFVLACACLSCFVGGTMYAYGVWGSRLKAELHLTQIQTNVLAGLLFSGGSFLTKPILDHVQRSMRSAALCPALAGAIAYLLLAILPAEWLTMNLLVLLMCVIGYSVMGLFIAGVQAIDYVSKKDHFNLNVGTAIAQTSYGVGCMVWVTLLRYVENDWRSFCLLVTAPTALAGVCACIFYPTAIQVETVYDTDSDTAVKLGNDDRSVKGHREEKQSPDQLEADRKEHDDDDPTKAGFLFAIVLALYCIWYGSAITLESNSGNLMESLGAADDAFLLVLGFGVGQTLGRLSSLFFALWARASPGDLSKKRILMQPVVGTILLLCTHAFASLSTGPRSAFAVIAVSGIPYGLSWTSLFHTLHTVFASAPPSVTLGMAFGPGVGPLAMNALVGWLYEGQIEQGANQHDKGCVGPHCYLTSFYALVAFDVVAVILALTTYAMCANTVLPIRLSRFSDSANAVAAL